MKFSSILKIDVADESRMVEIAYQFVGCSYPLRPNAIAMSDRCRQLARSAVVDQEGNRLYSCSEHRGLISGDQPGEVVTETLVRKYRVSVRGRPALISGAAGYEKASKSHDPLQAKCLRALSWGMHARKLGVKAQLGSSKDRRVYRRTLESVLRNYYGFPVGWNSSFGSSHQVYESEKV